MRQWLTKRTTDGCNLQRNLHFQSIFSNFDKSFRCRFQKATNAPATSESDLDSLKPIVTFPDFSQFSTLSQGSVSIFDPPTAFYNLLCIPNNLSLTNSTCSVKNASPGSAPQGFGTGDPVASTMIWADATAFMEWHCFEGDRQVFNVISLNKSLTPSQIEAITAVVVSLGFSPDNFATQTYA